MRCAKNPSLSARFSTLLFPTTYSLIPSQKALLTDFKVFPPNLGIRFCRGKYGVVGEVVQGWWAKARIGATFRLIWDGGVGGRRKRSLVPSTCDTGRNTNRWAWTPKAAVEAMLRRQATLDAVGSGWRSNRMAIPIASV
jgi:hypothetical protein